MLPGQGSFEIVFHYVSDRGGTASGVNLGKMRRTELCKPMTIQALHISTDQLETAHHVCGFAFFY